MKNKYLRFVSVAFQMILIIAGGALLGMYIDGEASKTYTIVFTLLSVVIAMFLVIKEAMNMIKK